MLTTTAVKERQGLVAPLAEAAKAGEARRSRRPAVSARSAGNLASVVGML